MRFLATFFVTLSISLTGFAQSPLHTVSEERAYAMTQILNSTQIKSLLRAEDGIGNIMGIQFLSTDHVDGGSDKYEVSFKKLFTGIKICKMIVDLNSHTFEIRTLSEPSCN